VLRILPNHACATAAQHAEYHVLEDNVPVETWERFNGW
jgi:D-serine deaminase-like pyridoxal phosphate-dependent protein